MIAPDPTTIDNRYRGNRMPGILETPEMMGGTYGILGMLGPQPGISNTIDLAGGKKIQDYLAGAGTSTTGPGGSTLYTGSGNMPGPIAARPPGFVDRPGGPITDNMGMRPLPVMPRPGPGFPNPGIGGGIGGIGGGAFPFTGGPGMPGGILPQPSPSPGQPDFGEFKDDLLSGIGDLFKQYFDQQQDAPSINQPFDQDSLGIGNSKTGPTPPLGLFDQNIFAQNNPTSQQVFGSMLTPNFGGNY